MVGLQTVLTRVNFRSKRLIGSIVVAPVGACLLLWLLRVVAGRRVAARA